MTQHKRDLSAVLRGNVDYLRLATGAAVSGLGSQLSTFAFPLLVLSMGGHAVQAGAIGTASLVTRLLIQLPAGHLADKISRRWIMLGTDLVRLIAVGSIPFMASLNKLTYTQLLGVAVIEGTASAIFSSASSIAMKDVVPADNFSAAFAVSQARAAAISLVGPALGGLLFGIHRLLPFVADAASYAISAIILLGIRARQGPRVESPDDNSGITAGFRWLIRGQPSLLRLLLFACVLNLIGAAAEVAVVIVLRAHGTASSTIGLVMASAGVGAIVGSLFASRIIAMLKTGLLITVIGLSWTLGLSVFAVTNSPIAIGGLLVLMLLFAPACGIVLGVLTISRTPDDIVGRVSAAEQTMTTGLASIGPLLAGWALQTIGTASTWTGMAVICAAATAVAAIPHIALSARHPVKE